MTGLFDTRPVPLSVGWVIPDYDEYSALTIIEVEIETTYPEPNWRRGSFKGIFDSPCVEVRRFLPGLVPIDEIELDGSPTYQDHGEVTLLIGSVGGKPWVIARLRNLTGTKDLEETSMKPDVQYTTQQLKDALRKAATERPVAINLSAPDSAIIQSEVDSFRRALQALPGDPQEAEKWIECDPCDIRPGDTYSVSSEHHGWTVQSTCLAEALNDLMVVAHDPLYGRAVTVRDVRLESDLKVHVRRKPLPTEPGSIITNVKVANRRLSVAILDKKGDWSGVDTNGSFLCFSAEDVKQWEPGYIETGQKPEL